jgi:hypothetical protein
MWHYSLNGPQGVIELTEEEMRRLLTIAQQRLYMLRADKGLSQTEAALTDKISSFRAKHGARFI